MKKTIAMLILATLACTLLPASVNRVGGVFMGFTSGSMLFEISNGWDHGYIDNVGFSISLLGGISGTHYHHGKNDAFGIGYTVAVGMPIFGIGFQEEVLDLEGSLPSSYSNVRGLFRHPLGKRFELQLGAGVAFSTTSWSTAITEDLPEKTFTLLSLQAITSAGVTWVLTPHFIASFELMTGRCIPHLALITDGDEWLHTGDERFWLTGTSVMATLSMAYQF